MTLLREGAMANLNPLTEPMKGFKASLGLYFETSEMVVPGCCSPTYVVAGFTGSRRRDAEISSLFEALGGDS